MKAKALFFSFGRGLASQCSPRMLLLTLLPFFLATALWGGLLWFGLQSIIDAIQHYFAANDLYAVSGRWLAVFGLAALKTLIVPLLAMWLLLPIMVVTALLFVGLLGMPVIIRTVGRRHYADLERRQGGSFLGLIWMTVSSVLIFMLLWIVTIPLSALPVCGFAIQPLLWGWLTYRLIAGEIFSAYADAEEKKALLREHRWPLLGIGTLTGALGVAPSLLWLGGTLSVVLFPVYATLSIWLYVLVFTFSGLWFSHYALSALARHRRLPDNAVSA